MSDGMKHINVCVCTYKRPRFLKRLLEDLHSQDTGGLFTYSIVVADNDYLRSAEPVVSNFAAKSTIPVKYCVEPQQNIAMARNKAIGNGDGEFIAFIDDDEFPADDWLCNLFKAYVAYGVDGVLGPVLPHFECDPPRWMKKGKFFERPTYATGYQLAWFQARTGNVLFRRDILSRVDIPFKSEFGTGREDVDFFCRMAEKGCAFVWCNEAVVYEVVPSSRCTRSYLLKRAMLRGSSFPKQRRHRIRNGAKSLIAVPCYALALPILALFGQQVFLRHLISLLDHASRLLAFLGLKLVKQREM
jgi:glycosyltransferase involved in cell wall biosynthesis